MENFQKNIDRLVSKILNEEIESRVKKSLSYVELSVRKSAKI